MLRELLGQGQPVKVKYRVDSEMRPGLKTASVWGSLPGTTDEDIIIIAHLDAYFEGAIDNASGLAVMMGLARALLEAPRIRAAAHIRFLGSVGHHGGPGTRWLHDNRDDRACEDRADHQPRARRGGADEVLGPEAAR